jgi:hypothetical protein
MALTPYVKWPLVDKNIAFHEIKIIVIYNSLIPKRTKRAKMAFGIIGQAIVNAINFWNF